MTLIGNPPTSSTALLDSLAADFLTGRVEAESLPEPAWGPIGKAVYQRTYSRDLFVRDPETGSFVTDALGSKIPQPWLGALGFEAPTNGRTSELWAETIRRVVLGNLGFASKQTGEPIDMDEAVELFELFYSGNALPAGRHLWTTGTNSPWSRNCWASGWSSRTSDHVRYLASRLFEGGGVGSNYSDDLTAVTSPVRRSVQVRVTCRGDHSDFDVVATAAGDSMIAQDDLNDFVLDHGAVLLAIEDTREGWVDAWCDVIDLSTRDGDNPLTVVVDVSGLRPFGAPLRTFGGTASGPAPFVTAVLSIASILRRAANEQRRLSGLEFMEIDHHVAASVVAGGARRSARMSLKHWKDADILDFVHCKAEGDHWSTNISVEIDDAFTVALSRGDMHAETVLRAMSEGMARNAEPGWMNSSEHSRFEPTPVRMVNPCGEASLNARTDADGSANGESCNLGSVNLEAFGSDIEGATRAFDLMARFLYRATLNPYPDDLANEIELTNRRIGVGFMGLQGWCLSYGYKLSELPEAHELRGHLTRFRMVTRSSANSLADELGLPHPVKTTAIAPTGSISQMFGTQAGGHPVNAVRYIRNVRYSTADAAVDDFRRQGYRVEDAIKETNTVVVSFPTEDVILSRGYDESLIESAADLSLDTFAAVTLAIQETFCEGGDGQAVSATGQLAPGQTPDEVVEMIRPYLHLKGFTAFPVGSYVQPPIEAITKSEYDELVEEIEFMASAYGDSNDGSCATGACPVK